MTLRFPKERLRSQQGCERFAEVTLEMPLRYSQGNSSSTDLAPRQDRPDTSIIQIACPDPLHLGIVNNT